ncbi:trafficking protein particle complex subunit 6A isoform X15 [Equus quagga]|uniref:trafficking protein particle complex subunit 6A isoform X15 n=1 Tax=Equus quagga TaxID=89248 RepID=UPI001EE265EF|nr:trafficking protein particle complex subunit 6A isoform X15 [Equus quagga]
MADAVLFEFLHTEMVAELWAHDPDPGPGVHREQRHARVPTATCSASASCPPGCGALCVRKGQNMSLSVLEGMGFRVGQALGERLSRETLAYREELDILKFLCKDLWMAVFQKQMDSLRTNHQASPLPRGPTSCRTTVSPSSSGWPQACSIWRKHPSDLCPPPPVPGLHLRPPAWHPLHPGRQEPGHRLRGSPACL